MNRITRPWVPLAFVCLAALAQSAPITYIEQATASGSLGSILFTNAIVTLTFVGDTGNVGGGLGYFNNGVGTSTVNVSGLGLATFTTNLDVFVNQNFSAIAGFAVIGGNSVLDTYSSAFATYGLNASIGPITNASFINVSANTTLGLFSLTSAGNSTFTAVTGAPGIPEPASFALLAIGLSSLIAVNRHRFN